MSTMRTRIQVPVPVLVGLVILVLVLGSAGTATGAGLTAKSVKKIAAKVVKKQAPKLSVAHATTADTALAATNATNLLGQPASQYKNPAYRFVLPVQTAAVSRTYTFPGVPAGSYLVAYSVFVTVGVANGTIVCQVRADATAPWEAFSGSSAYGTTNPTTHNTALLQLTSAPPEVFCTSPGTTFTIYSASTYLSTVTFTRVDGITNGTVSSRTARAPAPPTQSR